MLPVVKVTPMIVKPPEAVSKEIQKLHAALPQGWAAVELAELAYDHRPALAQQAIGALMNARSYEAYSKIKPILFDGARPLEVRVVAIEVLSRSKEFQDDLLMLLNSCVLEEGREMYSYPIEIRAAAYACLPQRLKPRLLDEELVRCLESKAVLPQVVRELVERRAASGYGDYRYFRAQVFDPSATFVDQSQLISESIASLMECSGSCDCGPGLRAIEAIKMTTSRTAFRALATTVTEGQEAARPTALRIAAMEGLFECSRLQKRLDEVLPVLQQLLLAMHEPAPVRQTALNLLLRDRRGISAIVGFLLNEEGESNDARKELELHAARAAQEGLRRYLTTSSKLQEQLITAALFSKIPLHSRVACLLALGGRASVPMPEQVIDFYRSACAELRCAVLRALQGCRAAKDIQFLIQRAMVGDAQERILAIEALAGAPNSKALRALADIVASHDTPLAVRDAATTALQVTAVRQRRIRSKDRFSISTLDFP